MPGFPALTHVAITVTDLDASTRWYSALFDAAPVLDEDEESGEFHHAVFALDGGTLFGLHTHTGSAASGSFDEHRTGLDHIAFAVSRAELDDWLVPLGRTRRRAQRYQARTLWVRHLVPRPRQHRAGVLRTSCMSRDSLRQTCVPDSSSSTTNSVPGSFISVSRE